MNARSLITVAFALPALAIGPAGGAGAQCCGDCDGDGKVTINELVRAVKSALAGCSDGLSCGRLPATGQVVCYDPLDSAVIPCAESTGQDGAVRAGATLSYTDNADGTVTDNNSGLMWEKKDDNNAGGFHDQDVTYSFADAVLLVSPEPGARVFLDVLNNFCDDDEATPCTRDADCVGAPNLYASNDRCGHAGYRDWRLPNVRELSSIADFGTSRPSVAPVFNARCEPGCTLVQCSCTVSLWYWSSTTYDIVPTYAWTVLFDDGAAYDMGKTQSFYVRAVRGGL